MLLKWESQRGGRGRPERKKKQVEKEEGFISPGSGRFSEANASRRDWGESFAIYQTKQKNGFFCLE